VGDRLALGRLADEPLAVLGESDDRGGGAGAFRIFDHLGLAAFHHRDAAVGGAEIDTDYFSHMNLLCPKHSAPAPVERGTRVFRERYRGPFGCDKKSARLET